MNKISWLRDAVFYNIYPQSFFDTNGDGIGDLKGITEKLDYIHHMGFNALWLNPFYESPFRDAGYDVTDFYKVAPRYGTMEDFRELCRVAHEKGIKVCIDLVAGHTSLECEWFLKSCQPEKNEYTNRYVWTDDWLQVPEKGNFVNGYGPRSGCYMTSFFYSQPSLNFGFYQVDEPSWQLPMDHPDSLATKQALLDIMDYWIDAGCDGFRVDQAPLLIKNDVDDKGITAFWQSVRKVYEEKHPDCVLISEWGNPKVSINAGFHIDLLIHNYLPAYTRLFRAEPGRNVNKNFEGASIFCKDGKGDLQDFVSGYMDAYQNTRDNGYIALSSGNHDLPRLSYRRDPEDMKLAYTFIMTMPGVPFIYYGDEIGMAYQAHLTSKEGGYNRTGSRTPMQWSREKNAGFSTGREEDLYLPVDKSENAPAVSQQLEDEDSLLNYLRKLIALRKSHPAFLADGDLTFLNSPGQTYPIAYQRSADGESFTVLLNPTAQKQIISLGVSGEEILCHGEAEKTQDGYSLAPMSALILKNTTL